LVTKGSLLNGIHNVHFELNVGVQYGAVAIGGDGSGLSGGIHASSFLTNRTGTTGEAFGGAVFTTQFNGGISDTEFIGNWAGRRACRQQWARRPPTHRDEYLFRRDPQ